MKHGSLTKMSSSILTISDQQNKREKAERNILTTSFNIRDENDVQGPLNLKHKEITNIKKYIFEDNRLRFAVVG